jgi:V/A-type H+/Na+-transporting ATPase subunit D
MTRLDVSPTRSNLLQMQDELQFAQEGYDILDQKREVLATELIRVAHDAEDLQRQVWELLDKAYRALEDARITMGQEHVEWAALAVNKTVEVEVKNRGVMGVPIPAVEAHGESPEMPYSLGDTMATLDGASATFRGVMQHVPDLAELVTSVWRLARELRRTQRRVNALDHIFIPNYKDTIAFIESALEEREREEAFRVKRLKDQQAGPAEIGPSTHEYDQPFRDIAGGKSPVYRDIEEGQPNRSEFG